MIIDQHTIVFSEQYLTARGLSPEDCCFFDIETTGFRAAFSHLYLIGAAVRDGQAGQWRILQWMAERPQEEAALLRAFADFLVPYGTILHFNGYRFDLPYLEEKYSQYQIPAPFTDLVSVDLYQEFRPLRSFLKLEHMNQKSLEMFLGLERDDRYDGGRLIPVYREFCKTGSDEKRHLLLLHNLEDVSGMCTLTAFYGYLDFLQADPPAPEASLIEGKDGRNLLLEFPLSLPVPAPVSRRFPWGYLTLQKNTGKLLLPMLSGTLRYYFPDYKNYYYLPQEDQAIHKSVAAYVDRAYRQPASAETCYTRQAGCFLPQPEECFAPAFRREYDDPLRWFAWQEDDLCDTVKLSTYLACLLRAVRAG